VVKYLPCSSPSNVSVDLAVSNLTNYSNDVVGRVKTWRVERDQ
jgi:hypothetical protein